jgi:hypothetical protein
MSWNVFSERMMGPSCDMSQSLSVLVICAFYFRGLWTRTLVAIEVHGSHDYFSNSHYFFFFLGGSVDRCHNLLYGRCNSGQGIQGRTGSTGGLRVLLRRFWTHWRLLALSFLCSQMGLLRLWLPSPSWPQMGISAQCCCEGKCQGRVPEGKDSPNWSLRRRGSFSSSKGGFLFRVASAMVIRRVRFLPSASTQLQHRGVEFSFVFSGQSLWRCPVPHHIQWGGYLKFTHICQNLWHLKHCIIPLWAL